MDNKHELPSTEAHTTASAAGALIRSKREAMGWSLADLVSKTTVGSVQYLHNLEAGRVNVTRSKHNASLAAALGLTAQEQALMLGIRVQGNTNEQPVDVLNPVDEPLFNLLVLSGETLAACRVGDEVVIVDCKQNALEHGRTYLVGPRSHADDWAIGVCVTDPDGKVSLLVGNHIYAPGEVRVLRRVLHRGRNL